MSFKSPVLELNKEELSDNEIAVYVEGCISGIETLKRLPTENSKSSEDTVRIAVELIEHQRDIVSKLKQNQVLSNKDKEELLTILKQAAMILKFFCETNNIVMCSPSGIERYFQKIKG